MDKRRPQPVGMIEKLVGTAALDAGFTFIQRIVLFRLNADDPVFFDYQIHDATGGAVGANHWLVSHKVLLFRIFLAFHEVIQD